MRTQSSDTSPEVEKVQIELLRKAPISKHIAIVDEWSQFIRALARQDIRKQHHFASEEEVDLMLVERLYGRPLAEKIRLDLKRRRHCSP